MLTTPYRPTVSRITNQGKQLLAFIRDAGNAGITRPQLAIAMGKKRLNAWHEAQLQLLEDQELIKIDMCPNKRLASINEFIYRATIMTDS